MCLEGDWWDVSGSRKEVKNRYRWGGCTRGKGCCKTEAFGGAEHFSSTYTMLDAEHKKRHDLPPIETLNWDREGGCFARKGLWEGLRLQLGRGVEGVPQG